MNKEATMKKNLLIMALILCAVGFAVNGYAKPTGTLRIATPDFAYESVDPIYFESFWGWAMYDPLIAQDPKGNYIPSIAESWKLSPDGKTWTFKIRKGIKFHNGDPLTSADVAFSVVRFGSKESTNPWSPYLRNNFESVETPDPNTFIYHSKTPEPPLIIPFAWTRILPKNYIEKNGIDNFRKHPIGSGPWKFVKFVSKTSFEMEANTEHWREVPAYERVIDLMVPEESTRIALLKRGEVDIAAGLSLDRVVELKKEGWATLTAGLPTLVNINFTGTWLTKGPTSDKRVRQAMSYSINRQELCDTFYKGFAKPGSRWFMEEHGWGWDPSWKPDPYDPNKAKALLKEAGYPGKFQDPVIKIYATPGESANVSQILSGYWEAAGIQTKIEVVDASAWGGMFFVRVTGPTSPAVGCVFPWIFPSVFNNVYHSANMYKSTGVHSTGNDPKADELYAKATSELDPAKAKREWTEFQNYAKEMWVDVGIVKVDYPLVLGKNVGEFTSFSYMSLYDALAGIQHKK
jgi:peptide/nickel transport system substrate-binding protein